MELTPEEKTKIYLEEKARIEAEDRLAKQAAGNEQAERQKEEAASTMWFIFAVIMLVMIMAYMIGLFLSPDDTTEKKVQYRTEKKVRYRKPRVARIDHQIAKLREQNEKDRAKIRRNEIDLQDFVKIASSAGSISIAQRDHRRKQDRLYSKIRQEEKELEKLLSRKQRITKRKERHTLIHEFNKRKPQILADLRTKIRNGQYDLALKELNRLNLPELRTEIPELKSFVENELYERVKPIPARDYEKNYEIYSRLLQLNPKNELYKEKAEHYKGKLGHEKYREARICLKKDDPTDRELDEALQKIDEALTLRPGTTEYKDLKTRLSRERSSRPTCYQLGVRIGFCGAKRVYGFDCDPENIPARCAGENDTYRGIQDGTDDAIRSLPDFLISEL
jgi:tetratricopeptide (TPR) repeat protein